MKNNIQFFNLTKINYKDTNDYNKRLTKDIWYS